MIFIWTTAESAVFPVIVWLCALNNNLLKLEIEYYNNMRYWVSDFQELEVMNE